MKKIFFCLGLALLCWNSSASWAQIEPVKNNVLKVCSDAGFLPFEMKNDAGDWQGFDVEMMGAFASSLHYKLEMVQTNFDGIIPALISGKCDMIAAGMTITPNREKVVSFSQATFSNGLSLAIKNTPENQQKYKKFSSLDQPGVKFAVKTGYTSDIYLTKNLKMAQILRFDQDIDMYMAVMQGRATAFLSDATYVNIIAKQNPNKLIITPTDISVQNFSVAARKQDVALMASFNKFLVSWKVSPEYKKTYKKYFQ